jgi:putative transposase
MARKTRMYLGGVPAHIVQRGNNRQACFYSDDDYEFYLESLRKGLKRYQVDLHTYCLMTNHIHLLMTPIDEDGISRVIQHVGREYVRYLNKRYRRTGTLWEGRHKGSLVDAENYLMACYRYIEMNPVAAHMVDSPEDYPWSSYGCNAKGETNSLLTPHSVYLRLDIDEKKRVNAYRALFEERLSRVDINVVATGVRSNIPTGNQRFRESIAETIGRRVGDGKTGRPRNELVKKNSY